MADDGNTGKKTFCRAAAKAGKSVLQLDSEDQYGSHWASLNLEGFLRWSDAENERATAEQPTPPDSQGNADTGMPAAEERKSGSLQARDCAMYKDIELLCGDLSVMDRAREYSVDLAPKVHTACMAFRTALRAPCESLQISVTHSIKSITSRDLSFP
eukprot:scaffold6452_cov30-Prasinocladus_malaysianus.AAC.2